MKHWRENSIESSGDKDGGGEEDIESFVDIAFSACTISIPSTGDIVVAKASTAFCHGSDRGGMQAG